MNAFAPATGSEQEWNAAYYRLEDYFRALHLTNKVQQSQLILQFLQVAARQHAADCSRSPTDLVMAAASEAMEGWLAHLLPEHERVEVTGFVSLWLAEAPEKWAQHFLAGEIPKDFRKAMEETEVKARPELQLSSMVPRPIDINPLVENFLTELPAEGKKGAWLLAVAGMIVIVIVTVYSAL